MGISDKFELSKARDLLKKGEVVAIPTETVYGLAASIDSVEGLEKVFALKERPFFDPLIVHVASFKQAKSLVDDWPPLADFLARTFWPGPLTLVLPKAAHVNPLITSGLETVAIRMPSHPLALELLELAGPLAAPSANKFGRTSPTRAEHVESEFPDAELLILDGGECDVGVESTVAAVDASGDFDAIRVLRPGGVTEEMLSRALERWARKVEITRDSSQASPGQLKHHYMPKIPLVIVRSQEPESLSAETRLKIQNQLGRPAKKPIELDLSDDARLAARELYSEMRRLAESGADCIFVRARESTHGYWAAIWDRLSRAASLNLASER